jgi:hypothetical protein
MFVRTRTQLLLSENEIFWHRCKMFFVNMTNKHNNTALNKTNFWRDNLLYGILGYAWGLGSPSHDSISSCTLEHWYPKQIVFTFFDCRANVVHLNNEHQGSKHNTLRKCANHKITPKLVFFWFKCFDMFFWYLFSWCVFFCYYLISIFGQGLWRLLNANL